MRSGYACGSTNGMVRTDGLAKLHRFVKKHGRAKVAAMLDCSEQSLWSWLSGRTRPTSEMRQVIHIMFGIDPVAWYSAEDAGRIAAAERRSKSRWFARSSRPPEAPAEQVAATGTDDKK